MNAMKLLIVCQYYYPENFQVTPIAEALAADGYDVTVLTGLPNYPTGIVPDEYRHGHRSEDINGVHVIRCYEAGRAKGTLRLGINYLSFLFSSLVKAHRLKERYDLVLCYQLSPVLMGIPAARIAKKQHAPYLLYCCDIWPESLKMYVKNENNPLFRLIKRISGRIYRSADTVICQSQSFKGYLLRTHGIEEKRLTYIPGFADPKYLSKDFSTGDETADFVFMGNIGRAQDLISVLKAFERLDDSLNYRFHVVGDGICLEELKSYVNGHDLSQKILFYGRRPVSEMESFYKLADACIVSLKADNETGYTLPTKVQGYMAAGKPIFGMIEGSAPIAIRQAKCGECVNSGDIEGFSALLKDFILNPGQYKNCGENARAYFRENFTKENCVSALEKEIQRLSGN